MKYKTTLVIGASENPARYSNRAIRSLKNHGHEVVALAKRMGMVDGIQIQKEFPNNENVDTVTLYIGPKRQPEYYEQIINLQPKRVIFNPGTENEAFEKLLVEKNIEPIEACTLVMLSTNQY